jgi:hypothetical protein
MNMDTGELYSVDRHEDTSPKLLVTTFGDDGKRPLRYSGDVAVDFLVGQESFPFRTANFHEFGLLVYPAPGGERLKLSLGQQVAGLIKPGGDLVFAFKGAVVRATVVNGVTGFGIKFDSLRNLKDSESG